MKVRANRTNLNVLLAKRGLSARKLSIMAGIGMVTAFKTCNGVPIRPSTSKKICDSLGVEFDEIFVVVEENRTF